MVIQQDVRLANNQTCTSKPQKWHVPSKEQQRLHGHAIVNEIKKRRNQGMIKFCKRKKIRQSAIQSSIQELN